MSTWGYNKDNGELENFCIYEAFPINRYLCIFVKSNHYFIYRQMLDTLESFDKFFKSRYFTKYTPSSS